MLSGIPLGNHGRQARSVQSLYHRGFANLIYNEMDEAEIHFAAAYKLAQQIDYHDKDPGICLCLAYLKRKTGEIDTANQWEKSAKKITSPMASKEAEFATKALMSLNQQTRPNSRVTPQSIVTELDLVANQLYGKDMMGLLKRVYEQKNILDQLPEALEQSGEMSFRDYVRGLKLTGYWVRALKITSEIHQTQLITKSKVPYSVPKPLSENQASMRTLTGTNEDMIGFAIYLFDKEPFAILLESATNNLMELFRILKMGQISGNLPYAFEDIAKNIWDHVFGAQIVAQYREDSTKIENNYGDNLHTILQNNGVTTLNIVPHDIFYSIPLSAAYSSVGNKFAIEYYDIRYFSSWYIQPNSSIPSIDCYFVNDINAGKVPLYSAEDEIHTIKQSLPSETKWVSIGHEGWQTSQNIDIESKDVDFKQRLKDTMEQSRYIHMSIHGTGWFGHFRGDNSLYIYDGPDQVHMLDPIYLASMDLPNSNFFLNACSATTHDVTTNVKDYTIPLSLLISGAQHVIATMYPVDDFHAAQVGVLTWELFSNGQDLASALHRARLDLFHNNISSSKVQSRGMQSTIRGGFDYSEPTIPTWASYMIWIMPDEYIGFS